MIFRQRGHKNNIQNNGRHILHFPMKGNCDAPEFAFNQFKLAGQKKEAQMPPEAAANLLRFGRALIFSKFDHFRLLLLLLSSSAKCIPGGEVKFILYKTVNCLH